MAAVIALVMIVALDILVVQTENFYVYLLSFSAVSASLIYLEYGITDAMILIETSVLLGAFILAFIEVVFYIIDFAKYQKQLHQKGVADYEAN